MADSALCALLDYTNGGDTGFDDACECVQRFVDQFFADMRSDDASLKGVVEEVEQSCRAILATAWERENVARLATLVIALSSVEQTDFSDAQSALTENRHDQNISSWRRLVQLGHEGATAAGLDGNKFCDLVWTAIHSGAHPDHYLIPHRLRL